MTLAIFALFCGGVILGPIVVVVATLDLQAMKAGRMDPLGQGTTRAAQIIGYAAGAMHLILLVWRLGSL